MLFAMCFVTLCGCEGRPVSRPDDTGPITVGVASWADEFNGPAGSPPDPTVWGFDTGNNGGWGNGELESYTSNSENVHLDGEGHLVIRVVAERERYTSARLKTQGRRLAQFGQLEARIKLPTGIGIWPAFWMLGQSFTGSNWPAVGEIDIMEARGSEPGRVLAAVHGPQYSGASGISATYSLPSHSGDDFHTFTLNWEPASLRFSVDGTVYHVVTPALLPPGAPWVFDQPFFVLLNVAVGGNFVGPPDASTQFPQEMLVDYVRYMR